MIPGLRQRAYYDINPTGIGHWTNQEFGMFRNPDTRQPLPDPENYKRMFINPLDNSSNLAPEYLQSLQNMPEAYRRRFMAHFGPMNDWTRYASEGDCLSCSALSWLF